MTAGAFGQKVPPVSQPKSNKRDVSGWIILNKPYDMTSTQAVGKLRWLFGAKKAGHAGTLDPLATGILPIALGEATKTVPAVQDGEKVYRFTIKWGEETATDDAEVLAVAAGAPKPETTTNDAISTTTNATVRARRAFEIDMVSPPSPGAADDRTSEGRGNGSLVPRSERWRPGPPSHRTRSTFVEQRTVTLSDGPLGGLRATLTVAISPAEGAAQAD